MAWEISIAHYTNVDFRERVRRKEAQLALINHPTIMCNGRLYWMKAKSVGAGVYEIYKTPVTTK